MLKKLLTLLALTSLTAASLFAQGGATGLTFLKLGAGARSLAMGEAYTALADDPTAAVYNPAALSHATTPSVSLSHREWIEGTRMQFFGASASLGDLALGLHINYMSISDIEVRSVPGPPIATTTARDAAIGGTAAFSIDSTLRLGATISMLYEKIYTDDATGIGVSVGALYRTPWDLPLALSINNVGSMSELRNEASKLPTSVRMGSAHELHLSGLESDLAVSSDLVKYTSENGVHVHVGAEFVYNSVLALRAGYVSGYDARNISLGFGLAYGKLTLDYAAIPLRYDLGLTHAISIAYSFHESQEDRP